MVARVTALAVRTDMGDWIAADRTALGWLALPSGASEDLFVGMEIREGDRIELSQARVYLSTQRGNASDWKHPLRGHLTLGLHRPRYPLLYGGHATRGMFGAMERALHLLP